MRRRRGRRRLSRLGGVESLTGWLLVSSPALVDPNFRRTVVLMTHHDAEGAVGLVLSRPSELEIADAVPELGELPCVDEVLYVGGPVQPEAVVVLVEFDEMAGEAEPIVGNVAYLPPDEVAGDLPLRRARVFAGYSGWGPGSSRASSRSPPGSSSRRSPTTSSRPTRTRSGAPSCSARAAPSRCSRRCPTTPA